MNKIVLITSSFLLLFVVIFMVNSNHAQKKEVNPQDQEQADMVLERIEETDFIDKVKLNLEKQGFNSLITFNVLVWGKDKKEVDITLLVDKDINKEKTVTQIKNIVNKTAKENGLGSFDTKVAIKEIKK